jgi:hypothetical protein
VWEEWGAGVRDILVADPRVTIIALQQGLSCHRSGEQQGKGQFGKAGGWV